MNLRTATRLVAAVLVVVALACMKLRNASRAQMALDNGDSLWRLTYRATFQANHVRTHLQVAVPFDTPNAKIYHEDILHSGLSASHLQSSRHVAREISMVAGSVGQHRLTARFDLHLSPKGPWQRRDAGVPKTPQERQAYLQPAPNIPSDHPDLEQILSDLHLAKAQQPAPRVYEYCRSSIQGVDETDDADDSALLALKTKVGTPLARARAMVALCRAANQPARVVTGFRIDRETDNLPIVYWVEALTSKGWIPYDPALGFAGSVPSNFIPVRRDGLPIVNGTEVSALDTSFLVTRLPPGPGALRYGHQSLGAILDLTRLPLEMHQPLEILLLMPLGALVTAIVRTVVGVRTFGTFTPTLLALSFIYANWLTGLATFFLVLVIGLTTRSVLDRLKLLLVPRLGAMLTLVVLVIALNVSLLDYFSLTPSAQAVILPMVILTMTVERFYIASEEDSPAYAMKLLITTICVGILCYGVLSWHEVGQFVLAYPEAHLLTIAFMLILGRFSGYRLTELWRFRDIGKRPAE